MSKPISFPLLEITTLLVVLFACVLVVVPGFDEFTTSLLLSPRDTGEPELLADKDVNLLKEGGAKVCRPGRSEGWASEDGAASARFGIQFEY